MSVMPKSNLLVAVIIVAILALGAYLWLPALASSGAEIAYAESGNTRIVMTGWPSDNRASGEVYELRFYVQTLDMDKSKPVSIASDSQGRPHFSVHITASYAPSGPIITGTYPVDYFVTHPTSSVPVNTGVFNGNPGTLTLVFHTEPYTGLDQVSMTVVLHVNGG